MIIITLLRIFRNVKRTNIKKYPSNAHQMPIKCSSNLPVDINYEGGQNLFLLLYDDHGAISIRVRPHQFTVEIHGDLVFVALVRFPKHHSDEEQFLAVDLGDIRELREVDTVPVCKSLTLRQQKPLVQNGVEVGVSSMEDEPKTENI